jgi:hypothetical protein
MSLKFLQQFERKDCVGFLHHCWEQTGVDQLERIFGRIAAMA